MARTILWGIVPSYGRILDSHRGNYCNYLLRLYNR